MTRQIAILRKEPEFTPESERSWKILRDGLLAEMINLSTSGQYETIIRMVKRASVKQLPDLFGGNARDVFTGQYALVGERTAESQKWCID